MSDYRNSTDPLRHDMRYDADARSTNAAWGWIAGAVFLVVVLALAFGIGHTPNQDNDRVANNMSPPAATRSTPAPAPSGPGSPTFAPTPTPAPMNPTQPQPQPRP